MFANNRLKLNVLAAAAVVLFFTQQALAGPPRFTPVDYPGALNTFALDINPAGDIVGGWYDTGGHEHAFLLRNGTYTPFDFPGSAWTEAEGISPTGDIVGQYGLRAPADSTLIHGFLLRNGQFYPVDLHGPNSEGPGNTMPYRISPDGKIVGCYHQSYPSGSVIMDAMQGFALGPDGLTFLPASTMNGGVNPEGTVVGQIWDMTLKRYFESYVIEDGVTTNFHFPSGFVTRAWDINGRGDIVGMYKETTPAGKAGKTHGFLLSDGTFTSIDVPGPNITLTSANGINSTGDIVGYYADESGYHGFLLSRRGPE